MEQPRQHHRWRLNKIKKQTEGKIAASGNGGRFFIAQKNSRTTIPKQSAMSKIHVTAKRDHLESLTVSRPLAAVAELVWNGFDAESNRVQVILDMNAMDGIQTIRVRDYGTGIPHSQVEKLFGSLGDSWKKSKRRINGRSLHGRGGKGRFKAFALGTLVEWITTYKDENGKSQTYKITGKTMSLDDFDITDPAVNGAQTGTEVIISNLKHDFHSLLGNSAVQELAKMFAAYMTEYPGLRFEYNGEVVDPTTTQSHSENYPLGDIDLPTGGKTRAAVSIIEWKVPTDRVIHLCDVSGVALYEVQAGQQIRAPGFNFTAYVKSEYFRELERKNELVLEDFHPDVDAIVRVAKNKIKEHFRQRLAENQSQIVERWKEERIYPYEDKTALDPVEKAERQVFDILAVNVESYLPSFDEADTKSRKFTFRLLAQAIRENPDSVQKIIGEVLDLKKEAQDDLAELLRKTPLSSIISSAKIVAGRLNFLIGLDALLFKKENKKQLLERDQLHKILENEAWLFDEEFCLAGSEQRLEEVLQKHLAKLGKREDDLDPVKLSDGKTGRVDLMFHKVVQPRTGEFDYLIVELKRPSKKIDDEVITQIKKYAQAVAGDERFRDVPTRWKFIAISNDFDNFAKREANQRGQPRGKVYDDADLNITVWIKTWAEVINDAKARLRFVNEQLAYEADSDSATSYLKKTHAKFIPDIGQQPDKDHVNGKSKKPLKKAQAV